MQSDPPQGDPRLQRTNPSPKIATGYVDPCIVYLETTLPGEIPLLVSFFAPSSTELRNIANRTCIEFSEIILFAWRPTKNIWLFTPYAGGKCILKSHGTLFSIEAAFLKPFPEYSKDDLLLKRDGKLKFTGSIKYVGETNRQALLESLPLPRSLETQIVFAKKLLQNSKLDWPSIAEAQASMKRMKVPKARIGKSLFRRFISSIFKKKPQPVPA